MSNLVHTDTSGNLPTHSYNLIDNGQEVGKLQIRQKPSSGKGIPENFASHIYYEIEPKFRRKGCGKEILSLAIKEAKNIGLKELIITCYEENVSSKKIIEANGGKFLSSVVLDDGKFLKYSIIL